jgi:hypothetical protein
MRVVLLWMLLSLAVALTAADMTLSEFIAAADAPVSTAQPDTARLQPMYRDSYARGQADCTNPSFDSVMFGLVSGGALWIPGTLLATAISSRSTPEHIPSGVDPDAYKAGYRARSRGVNRAGTLLGGVVGNALITWYFMSHLPSF